MFQSLYPLVPNLLAAAWLLPLASFVVILLLGPKLGRGGKLAAGVATFAILAAAACSFTAFAAWISTHGVSAPVHHDAGHHAEHASAESTASIQLISAKGDDHSGTHDSLAHDHHAQHAPTPPKYLADEWYALGVFGQLRVAVGYHVDALTVCMFCMVTFIASCIHFYASGYMHDELHAITDHEVTLLGNPYGSHHDDHGHAPAAHHDDHGHGHGHDDHGGHDAHGHAAHGGHGNHLHRPGRYHRFFQYLSLFCFSMLGLVIAGNIAMVFVFWELVGVCSYFLIGFYVERKSASTAANKAFIVNRVGDFGMIIGLMALWASLGTFTFGDLKNADGSVRPGLFSLVRPAEADYALTVPDGMVRADLGPIVRREIFDRVGADVAAEGIDEARAAMAMSALLRPRELMEYQLDQRLDDARQDGLGYWLLVVGGLGIFCGCVGKSAQFPLHVWLPDAMEGPTPVSALVHSATMVAAGVYLVGRFYPMFTPEVLLVIAYIGAITLFIAATIAITATDIKRVLAYSTVSQLGYMILALGIGGWVAGLFHLITHAFFKSLLFMCSGSVIHACHTNEMTKMGGLRHKMPYTAYTMLIGCLAIIGAGVPFVLGFSGYYSKDAIVEQALSFWQHNPTHGAVFFVAAAGGAAITAFYMFRLWYLTFAGKPRDQHIYDHAHESPPVMYLPLCVLSVMAIGVGWTVPGLDLGVTNLLEQARPAIGASVGQYWPTVIHPDEHLSHAAAIKIPATIIAFSTALAGFLLATVFYCWKQLSPADVRQQFEPLYRFLVGKWYFDELYDLIFIRPSHVIAGAFSNFDRQWIDRWIDALALNVQRIAHLDDLIDRYVVDGIVNTTAAWVRSTGYALHGLQTGRLRQYVMLIVIGTVGLTVIMRWATAGY